MATLTGRSISSSYTELLKTTSASGITSSLDTVQDGDGTNTVLQLSTTGVKSTGTLEVAGITTATGGVVGALTGNVTGNLTGDVTGDLTGDVTGDLTGNADTVTTNANLTGEVTSSGNAATIAADVVDEANLKVSNAPTNGYVLSAQSGDTGGLTWVDNTHAAGTVTSVSGAGTVNGLTLTGTVTSSGSLTLGGTLSSVANSALTNSAVTVGTTAISLGASSTTLAGLTSVTSTGFTGDVTGNVSGTAATVTGAAQTAITSVGTLTSLGVGVAPATGATVDIKSTSTGGISIVDRDSTDVIAKLSWGAASDAGMLDLLDNNVTKTRLYANGDSYFTGGSVGIGTAVPHVSDQWLATDETLSVVGGSKAGSVEIGHAEIVNGVIHGALKFVNTDNSDASAATSRFVSGMYSRIITSDSNAGDDSGGSLHLSVKPESGTMAEALTILSDGKVGVGVVDPDSELEINGQIKITGGVPGADKVLTSDANGLATWETASGGGGLTLDTTVKTASFTAVAGNQYLCNTNGGAFNMTLPAGTAGDTIGIIDYLGDFGTNNLTLVQSGSEKIFREDENGTINTVNFARSIKYIDATVGWLAVGE